MKNEFKTDYMEFCDRCSRKIPITSDKTRVYNKTVSGLKTWGSFCPKCSEVVLQGICSSCNEGRITMGISNHKLINYLGDIFRRVSKIAVPTHIEIEELDRYNLLIQVSTMSERDSLFYTYNTESKILFKVPSRRKKIL